MENEIESECKEENVIQTWRKHIRDPVYRKKFICTMFLLAVFIYLGLGAGIGGPTFLDLMLITNTELEQASSLFTAGAVGYMLGAFCSGIVYDKCNKLLLLAIVTIGSSIATGVKPLCSSLPVMIAVTFLGSFFAAGIDTGGNADLIRLWGREGRSYMQTLHFCFALGGLIAPLIVEPFLAKRPHDLHTGLNLLNESLPHSDIQIQNSSQLSLWNASSNFTMDPYPASESRILIPYLIAGFFGIITSVPFFVEFLLRRNDKRKEQKEEVPAPGSDVPMYIYIPTVALIGFFFFNYCALEETFISFLTVFTVDGLQWTKADGALVSSVFWGSFAACRFLGIFFIYFISPKNMLIICLLLLVLSMAVFLISSILVVNVGVWVSSVGVGFATSIIFPTAFTWIEEHLIKVTGRVTSVIMISASSAGIATPLLLGYLMQKVTYMVFSYLLGAQSVLLLILFIIMNIHSDQVLSKFRKSNKEKQSVTEECTETSSMI